MTASFARTALRSQPGRLMVLVLALLGIVALTVTAHAVASVVGASQEFANSASLAVTAAIATAAVRAGGLPPSTMFGRTRIVRWLGIASGVLAVVLVAGLVGRDLSEEQLRTLLLGPSAFFEETLFRGIPFLILISGEKPCRVVSVVGAFLASIVFALLHPSPHIALYFDAFIFSMLSFCMLAATRSIWPPIAFHLVANVAVVNFPATLNGDANIFIVILDAGFGTLMLAVLALWLRRASRKEALNETRG